MNSHLTPNLKNDRNNFLHLIKINNTVSSIIRLPNSKQSSHADWNMIFFAGNGSVVPGSDYAYSPAYSQYGGAYGSYGYCATSGLLSK